MGSSEVVEEALVALAEQEQYSNAMRLARTRYAATVANEVRRLQALVEQLQDQLQVGRCG